MRDLTDVLTEAAGPSAVNFTTEDIRRRAAHRRAARRRRTGAVIVAAVVVTGGLGALVVHAGQGGHDGQVQTARADERSNRSIEDQLVGRWTARGTSDTEAVLVLGSDRTVHGTVSCQRFTASRWSIDDGRLVIRGWDGKDCVGRPISPAGQTLADQVLGVLHGRPTVASPDGRTLRLTATDGVFAVFSRGDTPDRFNDPAGVTTLPIGGPVIQGWLLDGRFWSVQDTDEHGLCVKLGNTDLGCDDIGPVIAPDKDPATPRSAADQTGYAFSESEAATLLDAYLPPKAVSVRILDAAGHPAITGHIVVDVEHHIWAAPIQPGKNPAVVAYFDAEGHEVARFRVGQ